MELRIIWLHVVLICSLSLMSESARDVNKALNMVRNEMADHQANANKIIDFLTKGPGKHQVYNRLATFVDTFGSRIAGSANLEHAIDYMLDELKEDKLDNVHGEDVNVTHWVRGKESAQMIMPRNHSIALLGLGGSVGTPPEGITAEVLVVSSFDELHAKASEAKGKIVVLNEKWISYGKTVVYRTQGATEVAKVGGLASLIRSVTPFSIYSPHTGWQYYEKGVKKIPTACITIEDTEMMTRMAARGTKIIVNLKMEAQNLPQVVSRNTVAEIEGSVHPEQVVLVSGHLDSWDVGQDVESTFRVNMELRIIWLHVVLICSLSLMSESARDVNKALNMVRNEMADHQANANKIIDFLTKGPGKHQVYNRLATFVDTFGSRIAGSANLEHAIDYMLDELKEDKLDNVHGEEVNVTHWVRGKESAQMIMPRNHSIALLGLGGSVSTLPEGVTAEVLVVGSFDELHAKALE